MKNTNKDIDTVICRLKTIQENIQQTPEKYDLETLYDILAQTYDELCEFYILVQDKSL